MAKILKKLSIKTVTGLTVAAIREMATPEGAPVMRIMGIAMGTKGGESDNGPWTALRGQFEASNLITGEVFGGSVLFLPDVALDAILPALAGDNANVKFALDITVMKDETSTIGYAYSFVPLLKPDENDPLEKMRNELKQLEAPKSDKSKK